MPAAEGTARKRLVIELGEKTRADLDSLVVSEEVNKTTVANRAIQLYKIVKDAEEKGGSVTITYPDGSVMKLLIIS